MEAEEALDVWYKWLHSLRMGSKFNSPCKSKTVAPVPSVFSGNTTVSWCFKVAVVTREEGRRPVNVIFLPLHNNYHRASFTRKWRERKWNGVKKGIQARAWNNQEMNRGTSVVNKPIIILRVIVSTACWGAQSEKTRKKQETRKQSG